MFVYKWQIAKHAMKSLEDVLLIQSLSSDGLQGIPCKPFVIVNQLKTRNMSVHSSIPAK